MSVEVLSYCIHKTLLLLTFCSARYSIVLLRQKRLKNNLSSVQNYSFGCHQRIIVNRTRGIECFRLRHSLSSIRTETGNHVIEINVDVVVFLEFHSFLKFTHSPNTQSQTCNIMCYRLYSYQCSKISYRSRRSQERDELPGETRNGKTNDSKLLIS